MKDGSPIHVRQRSMHIWNSQKQSIQIIKQEQQYNELLATICQPHPNSVDESMKNIQFMENMVIVALENIKKQLDHSVLFLQSDCSVLAEKQRYCTTNGDLIGKEKIEIDLKKNQKLLSNIQSEKESINAQLLEAKRNQLGQIILQNTN